MSNQSDIFEKSQHIQQEINTTDIKNKINSKSYASYNLAKRIFGYYSAIQD